PRWQGKRSDGRRADRGDLHVAEAVARSPGPLPLRESRQGPRFDGAILWPDRRQLDPAGGAAVRRRRAEARRFGLSNPSPAPCPRERGTLDNETTAWAWSGPASADGAAAAAGGSAQPWPADRASRRCESRARWPAALAPSDYEGW